MRTYLTALVVGAVAAHNIEPFGDWLPRTLLWAGVCTVAALIIRALKR